jgi:hypothetical protein
MEETQKALLAQWTEAEQNCAMWKAKELRLRTEVIAQFFDTSKDQGTEHFELGNGYKLTAVKKLNYTLTNKNGETVAALQALRPDTAQRLVSWSPTLSKTEYDRLSSNEKMLLTNALTIKPATPSLELVEPKK